MVLGQVWQHERPVQGKGYLMINQQSGPSEPNEDGEARPTTSQSSARYRRVKYRTKDGQADYEFSFERMPNGGHRAYIQPT